METLEQQMRLAHIALDREDRWGCNWLHQRLQKLRDRDEDPREYFAAFYNTPEPDPLPRIESVTVRCKREPRLVGITRRKRSLDI